jgi:DHA1 family bicyclomycin/chloramphenicol resistance-like MFS transporter
VKTISPAALTALLALIGLLNSLCADMLIPALPSLRDDLAVSEWQAQQTISLFLAACAFMSLWYGALADAWGRRAVTLGALIVIMVTAVASIATTRIEHLWVLRTVQGLASGAGLVISRTIVRDLHIGPTAQRLLSHIMMVQMLSLVATPVFGGWLAVHWGWRATFVALAAIMLALTLACWRWLPETLPPAQRRPIRVGPLWQSYRAVLRSGSFVRLSLAHVANWVSVVIYAFSAPTIVIKHMGQGPTAVYLVYVPITLGLVGGFALLPRLAKRMSGAAILRTAYRILAASIALNLAICWLFPPSPTHMLPLFFVAIGVALALPILIDWSLTPVHENAGVGNSCQTFIQLTVMAFAAGVLAPLLWDSMFKLALGTGIVTAIGAACLFGERQVRRTLASPLT